MLSINNPDLSDDYIADLAYHLLVSVLGRTIKSNLGGTTEAAERLAAKLITIMGIK